MVKRHGGTPNTILAATGSNITGGEVDGQTYTFSSPVGGAYVQIHPDCTATLYIKWNADTASASDWDAVLIAGGVEVCNLEGDITGGIIVSKVTIFSATGAALDEDFVVKGIQLQ